MEHPSACLSKKRIAVVTGANKGIGLEICRQLASNEITVILTSRDEKRGLEALQNIKHSLVSDNVIFHQLDVTDPVSVASLADFIKTRFGKLDILVNNAAVNGVILDSDAFVGAVEQAGGDWPTEDQVNWNEIATQTWELADECLKTNYYGSKRMVEALVPFLKLSDSPRIVNVSSFLGLLKHIPNEWAKGVLSNEESLTEEKIEEVVNEYLEDFRKDILKAKGWLTYIGPSAYIISKAALNAYTRILANKYPNLQVNCVAPGFVQTDITCNMGTLNPAQGAESVVKLALLPIGGPSGRFFNMEHVSCF